MIRTAFCFACFLLITLSASAFGDYYSGGAGEPNDPFQISTPEDLNDINNHPWEHFHKHFVLTNDIDLSGYTGSEFNMIGHDTIGFRGVFDGRGHTISNFMYAGTDEVVIGLFAQVASAGTQIKNIRLTNVDVSGESGVGGLVGGIYLGTIQGCYVSGKVSGTMYSIGGLTAVNSGLITDCFSNTNVTGTGQVGGLVGSNQSGVITRSFSRGEVSATEHSVGGLVGMNYNGGKISNCYSNCIVTGKSMVGGLVGDNTGAAKISSCYSTGRVEAEYNFGGLIGYNDYAAVTTSFWDKEASEETSMCGHEIFGGTGCDDTCGRIQDHMMIRATFTDSAWDFIGETVNGPNDVWTIDETDDYPRLVWEVVKGFAGDEMDFADYCLLADYWADADCQDSHDCDGTDVDFSGTIDFTDLRALARYWLSGP